METLLEKNRNFYQSLWGKTRLIPPHRFNTWPLVQEIAADCSHRLEIGPGLRPRLPIEATHFVDISQAALDALEAAGGETCLSEIHQLPFEDNRFDLVCALDIIEHVEDDAAAMAELCRVAQPGATILLSMPLFMSCWTSFDDIVGHHRRYEIDELNALLKAHHLQLLKSAIYGMQPKSNRMVDWAMNYLEKNPQRALWYYNHIFMPIGLKRQKPLKVENHWCDLTDADEIIILCKLQETPSK